MIHDLPPEQMVPSLDVYSRHSYLLHSIHSCYGSGSAYTARANFFHFTYLPEVELSADLGNFPGGLLIAPLAADDLPCSPAENVFLNIFP
jgi:hypothetical protein